MKKICCLIVSLLVGSFNSALADSVFKPLESGWTIQIDNSPGLLTKVTLKKTNSANTDGLTSFYWQAVNNSIYVTHIRKAVKQDISWLMKAAFTDGKGFLPLSDLDHCKKALKNNYDLWSYDVFDSDSPTCTDGGVITLRLNDDDIAALHESVGLWFVYQTKESIVDGTYFESYESLPGFVDAFAEFMKAVNNHR